MRKKCTHNWVTHTTMQSDFRCTKCGRLGKLVYRYNKDREYRQVVRALTDK